jgi:uncharacterized MAPEG superfamily protein
MTDLLSQPGMRLYGVCAAVLVLKMWLTGNGTGLLRVRKGVFISPEDYAVTGRPAATAPDEQVERVRRAHRNDLENILPFLVVGFLLAASGASYGLLWWLFVPFTLARVLHTVFYAAAMQPWRTLAFEVGNVALLVATLALLVRAW